MTPDPALSPSPAAPFQALDDVACRTIPELFLRGVERHALHDALLAKRDGRWTPVSRAAVLEQAAALGAALAGMELKPGDRVAILSENRPEWAVADYAALGLGLVTVPIYPTLPADQVGAILADAEARVVFASTPAQARKVTESRGKLPNAERVVCFDPEEATTDVIPLRALQQEGRTLQPDPEAWFRERARKVGPDDLATLIYTSGTTGAPKGVMLTHYNLAAMVAATRQHGSIPLEPGDVALSFLPLSHIFERAVDYFYWDGGVTIAYAESTTRMTANLREVQPHVMVAVPRLFEMIYAGVVDAAGAKGRIARAALRVGGPVADARLAGRGIPWTLRLPYALADRLVFSRLREAMGNRVKVFISGGAPLAPHVARLFFAAGLPVHEGYGLTETSPVLTANRPGAVRLGTVGLPYPGVELRLGPQSEILARTPGLMKGYWRQPEATAAVIDDEGWFHTGDVGEIDADGFLRITDRLKDLIVTAAGKNVAPQPLESHVRESPYVKNAVMIGDRRPYLVLLVEPELDALRSWAAEEGLPASNGTALLEDERVEALLRREALGALRSYAAHERPKKVAVLPEPLTVDAGLLTPTLKVRRRAVEQRFHALIERLYG